MANEETGKLMAKAVDGLKKGDSDEVANAIRALIEQEPNRWKHLLILSGDFWLEPKQKPQSEEDAEAFNKHFGCLLTSFQILLDQVDPTDILEMMSTLIGSKTLDHYYKDILAELGKLKFNSQPPAVQIHRLLALVEAQHRTMQSKFLEEHAEKPFIDVTKGFESNVELVTGEAKVSMTQAIEALAENVELALRLILHSNKNKLPEIPECKETPSPFKDEDLSKYLGLAGIWRVIGNAWGNMRFRNWKWDSIKSATVCRPRDEEEYLREAAGGIRFHRMVQQSVVNRQIASPNKDAYQKELAAVSNSIAIPSQGETWDGVLDMDSLGRLCNYSPTIVIVEEYVDERHYRPLIEKVVAESASWQEWIQGKNVLQCLADALSKAADTQVDNSDIACLQQVMLVSSETLIGIVENCTGLGQEKSTHIVQALVFDANRKHLEIWDQPLIPAGKDSLILAPSIVMSGNPSRALENFVTQWGGANFGDRGTPFEKHVIERINNKTEAVAVDTIKVQLDGEDNPLEFDGIVWWQGQLILMELKCEKAIFSPSDFNRAKGQIDKSIDQLIRRRSLLESVWAKVRSHERAAKLGLPEAYIGDENVHCVSLTNIMEFTGYRRDHVVVTDENAFFRFFGERMVCAYQADGTTGELKAVAELGPIRASDDLTPQSLMAYLRNPVQMNQVLNDLKIVPHTVPAITENSPGFYLENYEFNPGAEGVLKPWTPTVLSEPAFEFANELHKSGGEMPAESVKQEDRDTVRELFRKKVADYRGSTQETILIALAHPVFYQDENGQCFVGEDVLGQMTWWLDQQHVAS